MTGNDAFQTCVAFVLSHEGVDSYDPLDVGGRTRYGIAQRHHPHIDVANLSKEGAMALYRVEYWDAANCDELPPAIALCVFDASVNAGGAARYDLQKAVGVRQDGLIGRQTIAAVQACDLRQLVPYLCGIRLHRLMQVPSDERRRRFGLGWSLRVLDCHNLALSMIT